jgi:hypothetical protein
VVGVVGRVVAGVGRAGGEGGGDVSERAQPGNLGLGRVGEDVDEDAGESGGPGGADHLAHGDFVALEAAGLQVPGQFDEVGGAHEIDCKKSTATALAMIGHDVDQLW